jgi:hypothetical protein
MALIVFKSAFEVTVIYCNLTTRPELKVFEFHSFLPSFLPLGAIAQGELWPPEPSASILLYSSSILPTPLNSNSGYFGGRKLVEN